MRKSARLFAIAAVTLLVGCQNDDAPPHPYLGVWKLDGCTLSCGCDTVPLSCPDVIELGPDQFDEYRGGALYRSGPATYTQAQCISGEHLVLDVEGGPYWCLDVADGEWLGACENVFDGRCFYFRR